MKKTLSMVLAALMLAASAGTAVYAADAPSGEAIKGTPTIDGKIDDAWANAPVYNIDRVKDGRDTGLKSTFSAMWDETALYVLIIAEDSDHSFEGGPSVGDGMEIYMDFNNAKTAGYDDDGQAYFAMCADNAETLTFDGSAYGKMILEEAASVAMTTEAGRYIYEAKITAKEMEVEFTEDMEIGFDIQVNDQVSGETSRSGAYGWSDDINKAWESPEVFGNLTFTAGASAAPEAPAEEAAFTTYTEYPEISGTELLYATGDMDMMTGYDAKGGIGVDLFNLASGGTSYCLKRDTSAWYEFEVAEKTDVTFYVGYIARDGSNRALDYAIDNGARIFMDIPESADQQWVSATFTVDAGKHTFYLYAPTGMDDSTLKSCDIYTIELYGTPAETAAVEPEPVVAESVTESVPAVEEIPEPDEAPAAVVEEVVEAPAVEVVEEVVEAPAAEEVVEEAPATFDFGVIAAAAALVSAAGYALSKKR